MSSINHIAVPIAVLLAIVESALAQSIVLSTNGQSIVLSTNVPSAIVVPFITLQPPIEHVLEKPTVPTQKQWYLVSESWCGYCKGAKSRFLAKGWSKQNVITIAEAKQRFGITVTSIPYEFEEPSTTLPTVEKQPPNRYIQWPGWGTIDLQTYNRNCNCGMCQSIRAKQQEYRRLLQESQTSVVPEGTKESQEATPHETVKRLVEVMGLTPTDVLADLGCGDGRILIQAARTTGCSGVGIEIDPVIAETARVNVTNSGLQNKITIITGDAVTFNPAQYHVTAISAHLYEPLLEKLLPKFTHKEVRVVATPFHPIPKLKMEVKHGIWVYKRS